MTPKSIPSAQIYFYELQTSLSECLLDNSAGVAFRHPGLNTLNAKSKDQFLCASVLVSDTTRPLLLQEDLTILHCSNREMTIPQLLNRNLPCHTALTDITMPQCSIKSFLYHVGQTETLPCFAALTETLGIIL